jgi:hypothetical protein
MLPSMLGFSAMAVDLGVVYSVRNELQNAADAAALAGANTMITADSDGYAVMALGTGIATAKQYSLLNKSMDQNLTLLDGDIVAGLWDFDANGFSITSPSGPDELTAIEVKVRRDDVVNSPVSTYFARALGISDVNIQARSVALLGYAGSTQAGQVDLPIAIKKEALTGGDGPDCGKTLEFHDENNENGEWTTFFTWPTNDPEVSDFVTGDREIPPLEVGDDINVINGNLSNNTFDQLFERFQAEGSDTNGDLVVDYWRVLLPVIDPGGSATQSKVAGFCYFVITNVRPAPDKDLTGYLECGLVVDNSTTGGENFGSRAEFAKLIR